MGIGRTKEGRLALIASWAAMAPVWAGQGAPVEPALDPVSPEAAASDAMLRVRPALTFGPIKAATSVSGTRVTVVASHDLKDAGRSVHALVEKPGEMVRWVKLPLMQLPEAAFVVADDQFVCLGAITGDGQALTAFDLDGETIAERQLEDLLPVEAARTRDPVSLVATPEGSSLTVHLQCGTVALVEVDLGTSAAVRSDEEAFRVCSLVLSDKHSCGVDAWLTQARQLDRSGDAAAAKYAFKAAIETDPTDARGYRELANFYRRRGEDDSRIQCLEAGVNRLHADLKGAADDKWQVGTPAARLTYDYIVALHAEGDSQRASKALTRALELYPCMEQVVLLQAELLIKDDAVDAAVETLHLALGQLDPNADLAAAYHDVGRFLLRNGQTQPALRFLEDAFALGDETEFLLRGLADASLELNEPSRAADWLTRLASRWRSAKNGSTGEARAERAEQRLQELDEEITRLTQVAAALDH